jgi:Nitrile hydratase, alpha chain
LTLTLQAEGSSSMSISKVIARAWADSAYKATLLKDPHTALAEAGVKIPSGTKVKAVEDTADTKHLVLPVAPPNAAELSDKELEKVSGGINCAGCVGPG